MSRRRRGSDAAARIQSFVDARPSWEPFLVLGALPVLLNAFFLFIMLAEAENSWEIFGVSMLAAGGAGLAGGQRGYGAPATFLAAVWLPALMTWKRTYWALGMPSPGGTAQSLLRWAAAVEAPAWAAVALELGLCALAGWALMRFDRFWTKRTGRSLFDEE